jgi:hypothetical protein
MAVTNPQGPNNTVPIPVPLGLTTVNSVNPNSFPAYVTEPFSS